MNTHASFSPVSLSYVAALRGVKPRLPGQSFNYMVVDCQKPEWLVALAASNPEGQFYGLSAQSSLCAKGEDIARERMAGNVKFLCATARQAVDRIEQNPSYLPQMNYLCCNETSGNESVSVIDRSALFDLATRLVLPNGMFATTYKTNESEEGLLRFLVRELAPEMNAQQAQELLTEFKKLGGTYLSKHIDHAMKLASATLRNIPDEFFALFDQGEACSSTFDTMVAMGARGFTYAGDCHISSNYLELSLPPEAQPVVLSCISNPLYEPLKDFAMNRLVRSDIWCRQPAVTSANPAELFSAFSFGIPAPREAIPTNVLAPGKTIRLDTPLYAKLIDLMALLPISVGDFLAHPTSAGHTVEETLEAIQILVACGIAVPMRGQTAQTKLSALDQPRMCGNHNRYLDQEAINNPSLYFASTVWGDAYEVSARDALVMQALDRAGLVNSISALLPELQRIANNPKLAAQIMDVAMPTEETARQMIESSLQGDIIKWYAYGILEAA
ncbi:MAG: methyltransferase regulatory domain-containing protein [Bdellovibrionales bacterium]